MINDFRKTVQKHLNNIEGLSSGKIVSDDLIVEGKYHFGYIITQRDSMVDTVDYSNHRVIYNITGYLTTKGGKLADFDNYADQIVYELSKMRIMCRCMDITRDDNTRRMSITGTVSYDTIDKLLK